jgi:hypothetical protein
MTDTEHYVNLQGTGTPQNIRCRGGQDEACTRVYPPRGMRAIARTNPYTTRLSGDACVGRANSPESGELAPETRSPAGHGQIPRQYDLWRALIMTNNPPGRPPTANRSRAVRDAITKGRLDGRSSTARQMRRFKSEMKAELAFDGWSRVQDLDLRLAASFYGRLVRAEGYLDSHSFDAETSATVHAEHSTAAAGLTDALRRIRKPVRRRSSPKRGRF